MYSWFAISKPDDRIAVMIRIALVSPYTLPFLCGNSFLAERLKEGLSSRGYEASLFNSGHDRLLDAVAFKPRILHSLNADKPHRWVKEFLNKYPAPWIITLTGTDYNSWCGKEDPPPHIKENLERAGALVVFHQEALDSLKDCLPSVGRKIRIIPQGVASHEKRPDVKRLRVEIGIPDSSIVFLMVSSIRPVKNLEAALRAFFELEKIISHVRLILIGPVLDRREAKKILELGKKLSCFQYLGEKPHPLVQKYMAASDIFLNTSLNEGMPGAVLESMAAGIPILASDITGNRSLVSGGRNGLLFPLEKKEELVKAAVRLAMDNPLRNRMGEAGRRIVAENYSVERELDGYENAYNDLLNRKY